MITNDRGSTLIIAVVLAILMAIGGIGFVLVTTNSLNNDSDAYTNDKAFHAAESGALLAKKWLMQTYPSGQWSASWNTAKTNFHGISMNGLTVNDSIVFSATDTNYAQIRSEAYNNGTFVKRIVITVENW